MSTDLDDGLDPSYIARRNDGERRFAIGYLLFVWTTHLLVGLLAMSPQNSLVYSWLSPYLIIEPLWRLRIDPQTAGGIIVAFSIVAIAATWAMAMKLKAGSVIILAFIVVLALLSLWNIVGNALIATFSGNSVDLLSGDIWPILWSASLGFAYYVARKSLALGDRR